MFDDSIKTFMQVVKCGSFSKAAETLFLSPNAIKKRIQALEEETGLLLFIRTNKGVTPTPAGESLFHDFTSIHRQYNKALEKACRIQNISDNILCIGMMNTFSDSFTINSWYGVRSKFRQNPIHIVYYGNSLSDMNELFSDIGKKIDLCIDIYDSDIAQKYNLQAQQISKFKLYVGIPDDMNIDTSQQFSLEVLNGQTVSVLQKGRSRVFDTITAQIQSDYPEISVNEISEFSIRTFNDCYVKKSCILVCENQIDFFPFFTFYPLEYQTPIAFGVYYSRNSQKPIADFIQKITPAK